MSENFPTLEIFLDWAKEATVLPVQRSLAADLITPLAAYEKIAKGNDHAFILESVEKGHRFARYSIVGADPRRIMIARENTVEWRNNEGKIERVVTKNPLKELQNYMAGFVLPKAIQQNPFFCGGALGFIAYEAGSIFEPVVPRAKVDELGVPDFYFVICDEVIVFDHEKHGIHIIVNSHLTGDLNGAKNAAVAYEEAVQRLDSIEAKLCAAQAIKAVPLGIEPEEVVPKANMSKEDYCAMTARMQEYIGAGDIFQVVPSQRWSVPYQEDPILLYRALRAINPSPYMFCLKFGELVLVGSSPEVHVRCENGKITLRPIAGTRPRKENVEEDEAMARELLADEKERAEHLMLVDLARNDVGRVCRYNTVRVTDFMTIERYSHVMHIVSNVEGELHPEFTAYDVMRATFPAGTVTGAPKIRAMQIIAENEPSCRGTYAGAVGYFSYAGNLDSCIAIRTWLIKHGIAYLQAGGGLVADSTPLGEYEESRNKARAGMKAIAWVKSLLKRFAIKSKEMP